MVPTTIVVMELGGSGPPQPDIGMVLPPGPVFTKLPKKAKAVLVDPVVLLILMFNVAVCVPVGEQEQEPPVRNAPTIVRSFDTHFLASGQLKLCAKDFVETRNKKIKQQALKERNK